MKDIPIVPGRGLNSKLSIQLRLEFLESKKLYVNAIKSSEQPTSQMDGL